ncbi:MAG: hypothetical protein QG635_1600 [Bacteroidota bacterium]|nr:hypothetical protein [Bacteroidota bacterium]
MDNIPEQQVFSLGILWRLIKLRKKFIAITVFSVTALIIVYSYITSYEYQTSATILPPKQESGGGLSGFLQSLSGGLMLGGGGQSNQSQIFSDMITSRSNAIYISNKLDLFNKPSYSKLDSETIFSMVRSMISVDIDKTGLVSVTAKTNTPYFSNKKDKDEAKKFAATIANAAVQGLDYLMHRKNVSSARKTREYIEKELVEYNKRLDSIENNIQIFQQDNKILSIDDQTQTMLSQLVSVGAELSKTEIELNLARQDYNENSPLVQSYKHTIDLLKEQFNKMQSGGMVKTDAFSIPFKQVPELTKKYTNLLRDQKILEQVILYLETQRHQEAIQEEKDVPLIELLDEAIPPSSQSAPNRKMMLVLSVLLSFILSTGIVVFLAFKKGTVYLNIVSNQSENN